MHYMTYLGWSLCIIRLSKEGLVGKKQLLSLKADRGASKELSREGHQKMTYCSWLGDAWFSF